MTIMNNHLHHLSKTNDKSSSIPLALAISTSFVLGGAISYLWLSVRNHDNSSTNSTKANNSSVVCNETATAVDTNTASNTPHFHATGGSDNKTIPLSIRQEQLSRNELYFSPSGMNSITQSHILIVGLGGVGSHTAHLLGRSGVRYLRFVDFDQVTLSSLNRHACATLQHVGLSKVRVMKEFLECICPDERFLKIDVCDEMYVGSEDQERTMMVCPSFLDGNHEDSSTTTAASTRQWDMVIDAIDDVPTKAKLLSYCVSNHIPVVSCMGAAGKSDVTRLHISDLKTASRDPLASKLRQTLKRMYNNKHNNTTTTVNNHNTSNNTNQQQSQDIEAIMGDIDRIAVVYSSEKTVVKLADFTPEQKEAGVHHFGAVDNMRIRVLPVLGTMPAIMGQCLAAYALTTIGKKPFKPMSGERMGRNVRNKMFQHLKNRENKLRNDLEQTFNQTYYESNNTTTSSFNTDHQPIDNDNTNNDKTIKESQPITIINQKYWVGPVQIDSDDIEYIVSEVWRNRCCVTGDSLGTVLNVVRWDMSKPSNCTNLVVMGSSALHAFDREFYKSQSDGNKSGSTDRKDDGGDDVFGDGRDTIPWNIREQIESRLLSCRIDSRA